MGKIYYIIGKSASGKDSLQEALLKKEELKLQKIVQYTTRPMRPGEEEGREYHFISHETSEAYKQAGKILEMREYETVYGPWRYMLVDDGLTDLQNHDFIAVGTVESYVKVRDCFGTGRVVPLYVYVETQERWDRAYRREMERTSPQLEEMERRFEADERDFSDEKLKEAGLMDSEGRYTCGFENGDFDTCLSELYTYIKDDMANER